MNRETEIHESESEEEEESGSSRMRIIVFAILGYSIVACASYFFFFQLSADNLFEEEQPASADTAGIVSAFPAAAYVAPENDELLTAQQINTANLQPVNDAVALATLLGNNPDIRTIYIHPAMLSEIEPVVFQRHYQARKLLVAINTPLSELAAVLEITPSVPDLPLEEFVGGTAVAAIQLEKAARHWNLWPLMPSLIRYRV